MFVENIEIGKKYSTITVNGIKYEKFSTEVVYREGLKAGEELSSDAFYALKLESEKLCAKDYLFDYLSRYVKSRKEASKKLYEKGFGKISSDYALDKAEEYGILNDSRYAEMYVSAHIKRKGQRKIKYELKQKGISDSIIDEFEFPVEEERTYAAAIAKKFLKNKADIPTDKLYRYLASKGYSHELIKEVISNVTNIE